MHRLEELSNAFDKVKFVYKIHIQRSRLYDQRRVVW
jgi:hypothetical protein